MTLDRELVSAALPGYELGEEIGRGGWGLVLRARHLSLGRDVAIKQLPRAFAVDERTKERFIEEARTVAQLDHPHIVKVFDFVDYEGMWLIVMEYLGGGTLWDRFQRDGVRADAACAYTLAMCAALQTAHESGVLHRDIKPENILFTADGIARLGDFGIAKALDGPSRLTVDGEVVGTPTYMSPEQALGEALTPSSDVYSLGIVIYELMAGRPPFDQAASPTQQLIQRVNVSPVPLREFAPDVAPPVADAIMVALEREPPDRYGSAQAFGVALAHAAGESFGNRWLNESGVRLMGGSRIEEAALRGPTMGAPLREPTTARPAVSRESIEEDVPGAADSLPPAAAGETTIAPSRPVEAVSEVEPALRADDGGVSASAVAAASAAGGEGGDATSAGGQGGHVTSAGGEEGGGGSGATTEDPPEDTNRSIPRGLVIAGAAVIALVVAVVAVLALSREGGDPGDSTETVAERGAESTTESTVAEPTSTPTAAATDEATPEPTVESTTSTTAAAEAVADDRECPPAKRCAFIDSVEVALDSLVIEWTPIGFEPVIAEEQFHVHFFWDIYSADQAGTNAATFGVDGGAWELTDQRPFISAGEMLVSNRPAAANQICVTVANAAHAVVDPLEFHCVPLPAGM